MDKHTPGPWEVFDHDSGGSYVFGGEHYLATASSEDVNEDEAEANANLIAAAPELLEACKIAYHELAFMLRIHPDRCGGGYEVARDLLGVAIAKAGSLPHTENRTLKTEN